ncbi:hypothetical protein E2C01_048261 [Portunus trituberculatus]|uniref:Uncharacterized protein n=1 Tax=Portunus trituberculatus TaxID=210409 RepID=A0A5B7G2P5_PORTR|nr:hypothetical protein [Portunus trituberculatus]
MKACLATSGCVTFIMYSSQHLCYLSRRDRCAYPMDPLINAPEANTPGFKFIQSAMQYDANVNPLENVKNLFVVNKPETATKYHAYKSVLNPGLRVHSVYSDNIYIPDYTRMAFTRIRLMSHDLKIETGRWSRIPRDLRVCPCDGQTTQTEHQVLVEYALTRQTRQKYMIWQTYRI